MTPYELETERIIRDYRIHLIPLLFSSFIGAIIGFSIVFIMVIIFIVPLIESFS